MVGFGSEKLSVAQKVAFFMVTFCCCLISQLIAADVEGIVIERPTKGRYVPVDGGFMVPYEVKIPGTDASFWMEPIPPGQFRMGSPETEPDRSGIEGPQLSYNVDPFWIARHEVTQGEYRHYMKMSAVFSVYDFKHFTEVKGDNAAGAVDAVTAPTVIYEPDFVFEKGEHVDMPMMTMTQYAAKQYSKWLSLITESQFRLPTEAEWEYACRAGSATAYHFGDDPAELENYAWYAKNSYDAGLRKVGTKKPNAWGLYDMHGNVAEWVHDHCEKYVSDGGIRNAARDWVRTGQVGPKAVRGGSWEFTAEKCRSASRLASDMDAWREYDPNLPKSPWWMVSDPARGVGMRLVRPLKPMTAAERLEFWEPADKETKGDVEDRLAEGRGNSGRVSKELMEAVAAAEATNAKQKSDR